MSLYKVKSDKVISSIIWITIICLCVGIVVINKQIVTIVFTITNIFLLSIFYMTYYKFKDKYLYLRQGPFFEKIKYEKITEVEYCKNYYSSMALSRDRIMIKHGKNIIFGITYISPKEKEEFMKELKRNCINLKE